MFSAKCPFCTRQPFWAAPRRPNILKVFWIFQGVAKKQGKTSVFWLSHVRFFFSISSPHGHLSSWHTFLLANVSFILAFLLLMLCFPSFRWLCFLVSIHLYFSCVHYFSFGCLSLLSSLLVGQKPRSNHKISQILIVIFCFGGCIPTLSLGPDNNLLGQEKNLSKNLFFVAFRLGLLAMCWNTYFYCAFTHHPNFAYKMGPKKKIMFHKMQNKNLCFRNGLLRKTKTFMFTKTQNLNNQKQR